MRSYKENDQLVVTDYSGSIPDEEFYSQLGFSHSSVTPIMKPASEISEDDFFSKRVFEAGSYGELVDDIEGSGMLVFRYDGQNLEMESKFQGIETEFKINEIGREELEVMEDILEDYSNNQKFTWSTNANSYLSMNDLRDGLSNPVGIVPEIQGVSGISCNPHSHVELRHFSPTMIEIEEDFLNSQAEEFPGSRDSYLKLLEKTIRGSINENDETNQKVEVLGREIEVKNSDWEKRNYPVDTESIESILNDLQLEGFETQRIKLGPSQQPKDQDIFTSDFEEI